MKITGNAAVKTVSKAIAGLAITLAFSAKVLAHDIYIWPSYFSLNYDKAVKVPVFVTASHTTFRPDFPMASNDLAVYGVDGKQIRRIGSYYQGARFSTFDLNVEEQGTYALTYNRKPSYIARYTVGKRDAQKRMRGVTKDQIKTKLPEGAKNVKIARYTTTAMSFITNKAPTDTVLATKGKGFELAVLTHPADYVTGEDIKVKFLYDGKPVADVNVIIEIEGTQYQQNPEAKELKSNADGEVEFSLEKGGRYMLKVAHEQPSIDPQADIMVSRVYYAFEVIHE